MNRVLQLLAVVAVICGSGGQLAHADGWWKGCDSDQDPSNGAQCGCASSSATPASIGTALGLVGLVAYRLGRGRRRASR